jgi:hypothetical protein
MVDKSMRTVDNLLKTVDISLRMVDNYVKTVDKPLKERKTSF